MKRTSIFAAALMCSVMLSAQTTETAVLFSGTDMDNSYLLTENVSVSFNNGIGTIMVGEVSKGTLNLDKGDVTAEFKDAFKLTANQDPKNEANYYSTFITNKGAYKVPETANAFIGKVEKGTETDVLKLTNINGLIHISEPVILRASQSDIILMPSCNKDDKDGGNALLGTEEGITNAEDNVYALSYGENGVGFYLWKGKDIGANKAYLTLPSGAKALVFDFDEGTTTGIKNHQPSTLNPQPSLYNLNGIRVGNNYKGIVIKNGKKVYQR